jgi:hypothetical protein
MNTDTSTRAMKATFLSDQDRSQVETIMDTYGLSGFDASVRLWGRGKAIDVHGTLGQQELSCLLAIARFLGDASLGAGADAGAASPPALPTGETRTASPGLRLPAG